MGLTSPVRMMASQHVRSIAVRYPELPSPVFNAELPPQAMKSTALTPKENHCLYWMALAYKNADIGRLMGIHENTVKRHVFSIMDKTGIASRLELLLWAWDRGLMA